MTEQDWELEQHLDEEEERFNSNQSYLSIGDLLFNQPEEALENCSNTKEFD